MDTHLCCRKLSKKALTVFEKLGRLCFIEIRGAGTMYTQGQRCFWIPDPDSAEEYVVTVCGIANAGTPILGISYIVCFETPPPQGYNYTHGVVFERDLITIPDACWK